MTDCLALKKSNCKNCHKCIRHCPVKSIRFSGEQAHIVTDECILCGQCFVVCPQNAKQVVDETEKVKVLLNSGSPVIASVAPSFIANYEGVGIEGLREAMKKLGFYDVEETAIGATIVKNEYERLLQEEHREILISSCCHSVNLLIQKYFKSLLPYLADVVSPMQAHCRDIRRRYPDAKTVFIGPCIAKKDEAEHYVGIVDAVLTFDELTAWFKSRNIILNKNVDSNEESRARFFPTTGGILKTMNLDIPDYTYMAIDGTEQCIEALRDIERGGLKNCFIEMSACKGSCIGGPVMDKAVRSPIRDYMAVEKYAGKRDFNVVQPPLSMIKKGFSTIQHDKQTPTEEEIRAILRQMNKFTTIDELNCGTCGYNTCREKAIAVFQGKAEITMCLPFLKEQAERFSDTIFKNTPNGLIVVNDKLEVQQINPAAQNILNISQASDVLGAPVVRILDPAEFVQVLDSYRGIYNQRKFLAEYQRYVDQTIVYDKECHLLVCIMRDVTAEQKARDDKEELSRQTIDVADKVVDKQMRVVQDIASLLGETVAETKIALSKLKESIKQ
ncbi:MAG: 4Fe-4S binding protein [Proteobacteria bacterium]|nr:4Fe-4S binding protein [Pseudomonadota bacterium]